MTVDNTENALTCKRRFECPHFFLSRPHPQHAVAIRKIASAEDDHLETVLSPPAVVLTQLVVTKTFSWVGPNSRAILITTPQLLTVEQCFVVLPWCKLTVERPCCTSYCIGSYCSIITTPICHVAKEPFCVPK